MRKRFESQKNDEENYRLSMLQPGWAVIINQISLF